MRPVTRYSTLGARLIALIVKIVAHSYADADAAATSAAASMQAVDYVSRDETKNLLE